MKYGIISYEGKKLRLDGTDRVNMGNLIQTFAAEYLLKEFGIDDYVKLSINDVKSWTSDEPINLLVYGWNAFSDLTQCERLKIPFGNNIHPIFWGFNLETSFIPKQARDYFHKYSPIGCRDEGTFNRLKIQGINAYISGCLTALLPQREKKPYEQNKIYFIDVPEELYEFVPETIMNKAQFDTNMFQITRTFGINRMTDKEMAILHQRVKGRLDDMVKYARLVVTSRLHIASPCVSMGIPVILVKKNIDKRFAWLDKYIPLYSKSNWKEIDWNPNVVDYEKEKSLMKMKLKKLFLENKFQEDDKKFFHHYYSNRDKGVYNEIIRTGFCKYYEYLIKYNKISICGVVVDAIWIVSYVKEEYPEILIDEVYDEYFSEESYFEGVKVKKISNIIFKDDVIYLITSRNATRQLADLMKNNKFKYIVTDIEESGWKSNLV